ncbi:MAG: GNAT family N-acetyltransferase, partial [Methanobrevibacter sp.]|nr:GNAT family N-acetyltransferase [Methanobrevibacter sp.]
PKIAKFLTNVFPNPYTISDGKEFISQCEKEEIQKTFAIEVDGKAVGSIGIYPQEDIHCKNAEMGYWIGENYQNKGYVTKAIEEIVEYGFKTFNINKIISKPFQLNIASHKVLEKNDFKLEAILKDNVYKNGKLQDELIFTITREVFNDKRR